MRETNRQVEEPVGDGIILEDEVPPETAVTVAFVIRHYRSADIPVAYSSGICGRSGFDVEDIEVAVEGSRV
jgi:uncharacterized membrane protein